MAISTEQGFNVYVNGEYQKSDPLFVRDRGYPFNTADQSRICGTAAQGCLSNGIRNGIQADGTLWRLRARPRCRSVRTLCTAATYASPLGGYQLLNPALRSAGS